MLFVNFVLSASQISDKWSNGMKFVTANLNSIYQRCSIGKLFLAFFRPTALLKRGLNTGVFLLILQIFQERLFQRISTNDCFCSLQNLNPLEYISHVLLSRISKHIIINFKYLYLVVFLTVTTRISQRTLVEMPVSIGMNQIYFADPGKMIIYMKIIFLRK